MIKELLSETEQHMEKALDALSSDLVGIRTGRASPALVDRLLVDYYGVQTPLNQLASVAVPEPRLLAIRAWDQTGLAAIEKAIRKSDLGLTPMNDGKIIRISIPRLTEERRKELVKVVRKMAESSKVALRNIRRDANEHLKGLEKNKKISQDQLRQWIEKVQTSTDKFIEKADGVLSVKEKEILEI